MDKWHMCRISTWPGEALGASNSRSSDAFWEVRDLGRGRCRWKSWEGKLCRCLPSCAGTGKFTLVLPSVFGTCETASPGQPPPDSLPGQPPTPPALAQCGVAHAVSTARGSVPRSGSTAPAHVLQPRRAGHAFRTVPLRKPTFLRSVHSSYSHIAASIDT